MPVHRVRFGYPRSLIKAMLKTEPTERLSAKGVVEQLLNVMVNLNEIRSFYVCYSTSVQVLSLIIYN